MTCCWVHTSSFVTSAMFSEVSWQGGGGLPLVRTLIHLGFLSSLGILAFFFFTHRIRIVQDTAPPLNYYWVPILVWIFGDGWGVQGEGGAGVSWSLD